MKNVTATVAVILIVTLVVVLLIALSGKAVPDGIDALLGTLGWALRDALVAKAKGASTRELTPSPTP